MGIPSDSSYSVLVMLPSVVAGVTNKFFTRALANQCANPTTSPRHVCFKRLLDASELVVSNCGGATLVMISTIGGTSKWWLSLLRVTIHSWGMLLVDIPIVLVDQDLRPKLNWWVPSCGLH